MRLNNRFKNDFPILQRKNRGKPLVYLDSAASSQKPTRVITAISNYYSQNHANIHRGVYELSERATMLYENTREIVRRFIHAKHQHEIIFTRGTTDSINLVAQSYGRERFRAGDEIIISAMEHHSNIVPWQMLSKQCGVVLRVIPITDQGDIDMEAYYALFSDHTKLVAITHVSNVLGTINPIKHMIEIAHAHHVPVLVDGAQAIPHVSVDVQDLDCDFYAFSSHKAYGPTGVGVLYGKANMLESMPPYQGGGDMILQVSFTEATYNKLPYKFEAGTPHMAGVIGMGEALSYLSDIGMQNIALHEQQLLAYSTKRLLEISDLKMIGQSQKKVGVISFLLKDIHPHDIGTILDNEGVAIRAGHHCAMPLMERFGVPALARASLGLYNSQDDIDVLIAGLQKVKRLFS